ncbi:unnamed protein product [Prorocentrum cordatum]|uniref:Uncharacterized protein n=1 Tax=Prorocentrum cordatum TaxID=2364126 RepID=A0ABN9R1N5_9DINO|nr:unnamed protein product [Polarella glacialis]
MPEPPFRGYRQGPRERRKKDSDGDGGHNDGNDDESDGSAGAAAAWAPPPVRFALPRGELGGELGGAARRPARGSLRAAGLGAARQPPCRRGPAGRPLAQRGRLRRGLQRGGSGGRRGGSPRAAAGGGSLVQGARAAATAPRLGLPRAARMRGLRAACRPRRAAAAAPSAGSLRSGHDVLDDENDDGDDDDDENYAAAFPAAAAAAASAVATACLRGAARGASGLSVGSAPQQRPAADRSPRLAARGGGGLRTTRPPTVSRAAPSSASFSIDLHPDLSSPCLRFHTLPSRFHDAE